MQHAVKESKSGEKMRQQSQGFAFERDTFAFPNELYWEYRIDPVTKQTTTVKNNPPPTYAHHCFVVVRAAKQFLLHAKFDPDAPQLNDAKYAGLVRELMRRSPEVGSAN